MTSITPSAADEPLSSAERAGIWNRYWQRGAPWSCADLGLSDPITEASQFWRPLLTSLNESDHILELGAGTGSFLTVIGRECDKLDHPFYTGVDLATGNDDWRRWATPGTEHQIRFFGGVQAEQLPVDNHSMSLLVSQFCFEYTDTPKVLTEIDRVLFTNGAAIGMVIHHQDSRVVSMARDDLSFLTQAMSEEGILAAAKALMPFAAMANTPEGKEQLKNDPQAEAARAAFNAAQTDLAQRIQASDSPQAMANLGQAVHAVVVNAAQAGLAQAELQYNELLSLYEDEIKRLQELVACAWNDAQLSAFSEQLAEKGFTNVKTGLIHNQDHLMGWSLSAQR